STGLHPDEKVKDPSRSARQSVFDASSAVPSTSRPKISGRAYVVDGDTIIIRKTQIRLFGIDAPELDHPYGKNAKNAMWRLCEGKTITAEILETDAYGRTVAKCWLPDGRDLSAELVKQGLALDWKKFSGGIYRHLEAPDARKRLWLADARQQGRMYVWENFEANRRT
ncbi:thermonuclease family protein, partial [Roseicyclus sp.]|uniref:thermonuclease family protein n=1 Tax=Roseicyclus sp. TaxID=1914329 RepID=UPI003F6A7F0B